MKQLREERYYLDEYDRDDTDTMSVYDDLLYGEAIDDWEEGFIRGYLAA